MRLPDQFDAIGLDSVSLGLLARMGALSRSHITISMFKYYRPFRIIIIAMCNLKQPQSH